MRTAFAAVVCALVSGCGNGGGSDAAVDASPTDLAVADQATVDLAGGLVGGPCVANGDCHEGKIPVCWTSLFLNQAGNVTTPKGYCSSKCSTDADCGSGLCIDQASQGKYCFSPCTVPTDCRSGYACFTRQAGHCFPSSGLTCDPTAAQGLCPNGSQACIRVALGPGSAGYCYDLCSSYGGPGSCSAQNGIDRHCLVTDRTNDVDLQGNPEGDTFHGPYCVNPVIANPDGAECANNGTDYLDDCVDGDECYLGTKGDHKCHPLCAPAPDGGAPDGGPSCVCRDVFNLFGSQWPIGLCL